MHYPYSQKKESKEVKWVPKLPQGYCWGLAQKKTVWVVPSSFVATESILIWHSADRQVLLINSWLFLLCLSCL
jgi:hypothetical protein